MFEASGNLKRILNIPGVENIYVFGSSLQSCATQTSDVDIAVQTCRNMAETTRILVKVYLKIINQDVYTFRFSFIRKLSSLLYGLGLINFKKHNYNLEKIEEKVWNYRHRTGSKIDAGMFFDDIKTLQKVFYKPVEHLFMYDVRLFKYYKKGSVIIPSLLPIPKNFIVIEPKLINKIVHFFLYFPSIFYRFWQKQQSYNPNHQVSENWVNFVPTRPEPKFLVKL